MQQTKLFQPYKIDWKWHSFLTLFLFMMIALFRSQGLIIQFPMPLLTAAMMLMGFHLTCRLAMKIADKFQKILNTSYPSFLLWLYPTIVLAELAVFSILLVTVTNHWYGRGFWSSFLRLNSQETTRFFSSCFSTMLAFTSFHFLFETISTLLWISGSSRSRVNSLSQSKDTDNDKSCTDLSSVIEEIRKETDYIQCQRKNATKINRIALLLVFSILVGGSCWIIFFRPAIVLYYRAEFQLKAEIEPLAAYETLNHLRDKFPSYRYMDSVEYRMAWILDKRLEKFSEAAESYKEFMNKYAPKSVWTDEATGNLVRLCVDKLNLPTEALKWSDKYLKLYPDGILVPHMYLYRIRANAKLKNFISAKKEIATARSLFSGKKIQIIDSEDQLIEVIAFDDALNAELSANANLQ